MGCWRSALERASFFQEQLGLEPVQTRDVYTKCGLGNSHFSLESSYRSDPFLVGSRTWYVTALGSRFYDSGFLLASVVDTCCFCLPTFFFSIKKNPNLFSRTIPCSLQTVYFRWG